MRLFPKFLTVFLAVALAPLAFVGVRLVRETERSLRRSALAAQAETARRAADAVEHRLQRTESLLALARRDPALLGNDPLRRKTSLDALLKADDLIQDAAVYDAVGRPLGGMARLKDAPPVPAPDWGKTRQAAMEHDVARGLPSGTPSLLPYQAALSSRSGFVDGFLTLRLKVDGLVPTLSAVLPEPAASLVLSDGDGRALASTGAAPEDGVETKVPVPGSEWTVSLRRPASVAFEAVDRARKRLALALLAAGLAAAAACLLMARRLTRPLLALREAVRRMKDGDFQAPMPVPTGDELGDLAADLGNAQAALEKKTRDSVLGRMARMIAHDLRTPLQTVAAMLGPLEKIDVRRGGIARDALAAADDFIEQMLAVGRDRPPVLAPASLNDLVKEVLMGLPPMEAPAVETRLAEGLPSASLDASDVRRALANVLKNAREAAAGRVAVKTFSSNGSVSVTVSDDGPGLPAEKRARLFEEFTTKPGGAGLGLLVVKKVMDRHGGRVSIENGPVRGVIVRLDFPRDA